MEPLIWLILPLSLVGFALIWTFVCWIISLVSGWGRLAKLYPVTSAITGEKFRMQSVYMGGSRYKGLVTIGITPHGLYLAVVSPFRPGHPPLLIDWQEIAPIEETKGFWGNSYTTTIGTRSGRDTTIHFANRSIAEAIERAKAERAA